MAGQKLGTDSTIELDADGNFAAGALEILNVISGTLNLTRELADVTNNDSGGRKEYLDADGDATVSAQVHYNPQSGNAHQLLVDNHDDPASNPVYVRVRPSVGSGEQEYESLVRVTSLSISMPHAEGVTMDIDLQFTGAITIGAQA